MNRMFMSRTLLLVVLVVTVIVAVVADLDRCAAFSFSFGVRKGLQRRGRGTSIHRSRCGAFPTSVSSSTSTTSTTSTHLNLQTGKGEGEDVNVNVNVNVDSVNVNIPIQLTEEQQSQLCDAAERFMNKQSGYFSPMMSSDILADDFIFRGPVIGPLNKADYIEVLDYFKIYQAFPDIRPNCYGFAVDPSSSSSSSSSPDNNNDNLKVRFFVKATGTYQTPLGGFLGTVAKIITPPDGRQYRGSTEAWSITFNDLDRMQVKCLTAGYVIDRFEDESSCTTGGKGLSFGILNTVGLPQPTSSGKMSPLRFIQAITTKFSDNGGGNVNALFPKAFSDPETIPEWWKDPRRGAE